MTIGLFIWGFSFLKGQRIFSPSTTFYVIYENVGGLAESSDIILSGYKIGHVDGIRFEGINKMTVRLVIESRFQLPRGSIARIFSSDILSARAIQIVPGLSSEMHLPGDTLTGEIEPDFIEAISNYLVPLTARASDLMASMDSMMNIFHSVLDDDFRENFAGIVGNIDKTMISLQRSVYSADTLLTLEDSRLNRIIDNLESISGNLSGSNEDISTILSNFASVSDSLARAEIVSTINHLNAVLSETALVMEKIERGEGSLGKLMSDENLYNNLESATENLDLLLMDIKDRPGRYVNFSVFGRRRD